MFLYVYMRARTCVCVCVFPGAWACAFAYARVALLVQHATRIRHILLSFVVSLAPPHFSTLSHKRHDFRKESYLQWNVSFDLLYNVYQKNFSFKEEFSEILSYMWKRLYVKYPFIFSDFNETWIFSTNFRKNVNIKFHQNPFSGSQAVSCGQTDGWTDRLTWRS